MYFKTHLKDYDCLQIRDMMRKSKKLPHLFHVQEGDRLCVKT